jgi:hypothetical protein
MIFCRVADSNRDEAAVVIDVAAILMGFAHDGQEKKWFVCGAVVSVSRISMTTTIC